MDYVTSNTVITKEQKSESGATILAYDMAFAKPKKERKENKKHA